MIIGNGFFHFRLILLQTKSLEIGIIIFEAHNKLKYIFEYFRGLILTHKINLLFLFAVIIKYIFP